MSELETDADVLTREQQLSGCGFYDGFDRPDSPDASFEDIAFTARESAAGCVGGENDDGDGLSWPEQIVGTLSILPE